jgi:uncharacterized protein (DUF1810 family)
MAERNAEDLERFVAAQAPVFADVVAELRAGRKTGHWIWFVFPQIQGLGFSAMNRRFAIATIDEARAYLDHPVLGPRLIECAELVRAARGRTAQQILGADDVKLRSSMTLFAQAAPDVAVAGARRVLRRGTRRLDPGPARWAGRRVMVTANRGARLPARTPRFYPPRQSKVSS